MRAVGARACVPIAGGMRDLPASASVAAHNFALLAPAVPPLQQQVPATTDMLSQQYAALLLQNAQQAQLVQQLSSQQQAAHAVAIQQALSAAATAAGITSPTFSPEQLLLGQATQQGVASAAGMQAYASMPLPDMSSPFASAAFPPESGFSLPPEAGARGPAGVAAAGLGPVRNKSGGSPRSASAEQHLIGEALHSFVVSLATWMPTWPVASG